MIISILLWVKRKILILVYEISRLFGVDKKTLSTLIYHSISSQMANRYTIDLVTFAKEMKRIRAHARFLSLKELLQVLDGKEIRGPAVWLTVDDGYADVIEILPITRKYKIPVALFVLADPEYADYKQLTQPGRLLSWEELKMLVREGWTIGCHSATHPDFRDLSREQLVREIIEAKQILEKNLGIPVEYFAYPKGVHNEAIVATVKAAGYKAAFAVEYQCLSKDSNRWALPRILIDRSRKPSEFPALYSPPAFAVSRLLRRVKFWEMIRKYESA